MQVRSHGPRSPLRLGQPIEVTWTIENDGGEPLDVHGTPREVRHLVRGECVDWATVANLGAATRLDPGATTTIVISWEPAFSEIYRGRSDLETLAYACELTLVAGSALLACSASLDVVFDLRRAAPVRTPSGDASRYVVDGERVLYASTFSRAFEGRFRVLKVDRAVVRALDRAYLVAGAQAFRNGRPLKGIRGDELRVLSPVFASDGRTVLTSYGDAKVADPASFVALDEGDAYSLGPSSYRAGFGRDAQHVYYFDESTGGKAAVRLRGCKHPDRFVALGKGYGKDDEAVFLEATRIAGARPATFRVIGGYSTDGVSVFYGTRTIDGADAERFEVLPPVVGERAEWGKDGKRYYERGQARTEQEYAAAVRKRR